MNTDCSRIDETMWKQYQEAGERALRLRNIAEAERMFRLALERSQRFGEKDMRIMQTLRHLVKCLVDTRQYQRAEDLLEPLMEKLFTEFGAKSPELLETMRLLAKVYEHQCKFSKAASILKCVMDNHPNRISRDGEFIELKREYETFVQMTGKFGHKDVFWNH